MSKSFPCILKTSRKLTKCTNDDRIGSRNGYGIRLFRWYLFDTIKNRRCSGARTELLAKEDAKIGALIGTGGQAQSQLEAMLTVRKLEEVRIFDIDFERADQFAEEMMQQFSVTMRPTKPIKNALKEQTSSQV